MTPAQRYGAPKQQPFDHWLDRHPDVIIVAVYYRLSVLGFLSHPDFRSSGVADNNVGIYDQIEALKWIKSYISKFGGDPDQVRGALHPEPPRRNRLTQSEVSVLGHDLRAERWGRISPASSDRILGT